MSDWCLDIMCCTVLKHLNTPTPMYDYMQADISVRAKCVSSYVNCGYMLIRMFYNFLFPVYLIVLMYIIITYMVVILYNFNLASYNWHLKVNWCKRYVFTAVNSFFHVIIVIELLSTPCGAIMAPFVAVFA